MRKHISLEKLVDGMDFYVFVINQVLEIFDEEIGSKTCRLYSLPYDYDSIDQRYHLKTSEDVRSFIHSYQAALVAHLAKNKRKSRSNSPTTQSSKSSNRSQVFSNRCRSHYENSCLFCDYWDHSNRNTAYLFEVKDHNSLDSDMKDTRLLVRNR